MGTKRRKVEDKRAFLLANLGKALITFSRPFEPGWVTGYVLDVGPEFFLLAFVSDDIRYNGFQCFRLQDIRKLKALDPNAKFPVEALKKRGLRIPKTPPVDLSSVDRLIVTAQALFPIVTIHRERVNPGACNIGRIVAVSERNLSLLEINPDASWDEEPTQYKMSQITEVDFGGDYEEALVLVGGVGPK